MSADNWIECPFCVKGYNEKIKSLEKELKESYENLIAKDYDILKRTITEKIRKIKLNIEEYAYASIYDLHEYSFDENGNFLNKTYVSCPTCKRLWNGTHTISPVFKRVEE